MTRFSKLTLDASGNPVETDVRNIDQAVIKKCPHFIFVADHYRQDDSCRCDDPNHKEMKAWGYRWKKGQWR